MPRATKLVFFELAPELEEYIRGAEPADRNAGARARVLAHFEAIAAHHHAETLEEKSQLVLLYYAGMRRHCGLAATSAQTYLGYVVTGLRLRGGTVRRALRLAAYRAAIEAPVVVVRVPADADLWRVLPSLSGAVRRAAVLCALTGCRVADAQALREGEVTYEAKELTVAWSSLKQRKRYNTRVTIEYPAALLDGGQALEDVLRECTYFPGAPCAGVTAAEVNAALTAKGLAVTSRGLRVAFAARAKSHLRHRLGADLPGALAGLTGHHSDALVSAVYLRHAARGKNERARAARE